LVLVLAFALAAFLGFAFAFRGIAFGFGSHSAIKAPVGSLKIENQPIPGTSLFSFRI
jgi:hypothetical protein